VATCATGFADCNGSVADGCETATGTDVGNCGACGKACPPVPGGVAGCAGGQCVLAGCSPGFADCDLVASDGCESNLSQDPLHCGSCNNPCPTPQNETPGCNNGNCYAVCNQGWADCDANPANGCEDDINDDPSNCGGCGVNCGANESCLAGVCQVCC
jgi:hypothetical protein